VAVITSSSASTSKRAPAAARSRSIRSWPKAGEVGAAHPVGRAVAERRARPARVLVVGGERGAQRPAGVAGRRLDPDPLERALPQQPAVGDAVQRHAARHAQVPLAGLARDRAAEPEHHLLGDPLDRGREVHLAPGQPPLGVARRPAEERVEALAGHRQPGAVVEVVEVEPEAAVGLEVDQVVEDGLRVPGLAVGGEAHDLVLARVDLEAGVVGEGRVEQPERVREVQLPGDLQAGAAADADARRAPLADPVRGQDGRLLERRGEEGRGGVAQVVLGEQQPAVPAVGPRHPGQGVAQHALLEQLLAQPDRHGEPERAEAARRERQVGLEQALELEERLLVEDDVVDPAEVGAARLEAVAHGALGEAGVVLPAGEALLLRRRGDLAVGDEGGGAVVVERRDAEDPQGAALRTGCR
jgi:hypothetical protein